MSTTTIKAQRPTETQQHICATCGLNQEAFREMLGPGPTGCEKHGTCSTCGYNRGTLQDWLNGVDEDKAIEASLIIAECEQCKKVFGLEG